MTDTNAKPRPEGTIKETIMGGAILLAAGFGAYLYFTAPGDTAAQGQAALGDHSPALTLGDYADLSAPARAEILAATITSIGAPADTLPEFTNCMGNKAVFKKADLDARVVFGWCDAERINAPDTFNAYFNELDAPDLSVSATRICRDLVRARLLSPSGADFPWVPDTSRRAQRQHYHIASRFDAPNAFGTMLPMSYTCELSYSGSGDHNDPAFWTVSELTVQ